MDQWRKSNGSNIQLFTRNTSCLSWFRYCSFPKEGMPSELLLRNENVDIETRIRNDNTIDVEHAHSINSVSNGRRSIGCLESNRAEQEPNPWLSLSHIKGPLNISDESAKSTTRGKLISSSPRDISQAAIENGRDEMRKTYSAGRKYLAFRETKERRKYLDTFARRRTFSGI